MRPELNSSPDEACISLEIIEGVADVRLNRPGKLNALNNEMFEALIETGERLRRARGLRAVVLSGAGRAFSAGLDRDMFGRLAANSVRKGLDDLMTRTRGDANTPQQAVLVWRFLPVPVIAAIHGAALGGGLQIALGADIRYVAPDAKLSILEVKWGLAPDMGGVALLRRLVRPDIARELALTGRMLSGTEAAECGLATRAVEDPYAAALATAREIAGRSPDAVRAIKRLMNRADDEDMASILMAESAEQTALMRSPNMVEAMLAGLEPREPRFMDPE